MRYVTLAIVVIFFSGINSYGNRNVNDFSVSQYTTENGLPQNSVKAIASDRSGFYWLATEGGLVRFDGRNFMVFQQGNTGIGSNRIVDLMTDVTTGSLFAIAEQGSILSIGQGKAVLSAKSMQDHLNQSGIPNASRFYFHETWRFGQERYFKPEQDTILLSVSKDLAVLMTQSRLFWFLFKKKISEYSIRQKVELENVFSLGQDLYALLPGSKHFELLRITPRGTYKMELTGDILSQKGLLGMPVICVNNATGQTFISYGDHLYIVELNAAGNPCTTLVLSGFDVNKKVITAACYDKERELLILGSKVDGLYVFRKKHFQTKTISDLASTFNIIQDQIVYNDSSIFTDKGIIFSTGNTKPYFLPEAKAVMKYSGGRVMRSSQSVWMVSGHALYRYAPDFKTLLRKWNLGFAVSEIAEVQDQLWLGTYDGRVFSIDYISENKEPELVCSMKMHVLTIKAHKENVWIGTRAGLSRFNLNDRKLTALEALEGKTVRFVYPLAEDELWICTYDAGIYLYQNGRVKHFPPDKNSYLNTAHHILEDKKGYLWISSNNGIFQVRKKDLLLYANEAASIPYYLHYSRDAGFMSDEFNGGNDRTGLKLPNGYFCFSSIKGWVFFNPDSIKAMVPDNEMIIDRVETGNNEVVSYGPIVLENAFEPVTITIATAYFGNPDNLQYEYQFDNGKWISLKNNQITFNALPSGEHVLNVRKRIGFGNQYSIKTIKIDVAAAWWETNVFRLTLLLVLGVSLWFAFRLRFYLLEKRNKYLEAAVETQTQALQENINALKQSKERLTKENKFQQRLTNHIAHDIRTPLKYLTFSSNHLYQFVKGKDNPIEENVREIYLASEQIFHFTGRLISYLNVWTVTNQPKEDVAVTQLIEQKFNIFSLAAKERNIELVNLVAAHQTIFSHGILVDILLHNLLDNSIKNTTRGTIAVTFATMDHNSVITISDTGKGIPEEEMKEYNEYLNDEHIQENASYTGLGFSIIKNILPLIGARLALRPNQPQGTVIRLLIQAAIS